MLQCSISLTVAVMVMVRTVVASASVRTVVASASPRPLGCSMFADV